MVAKNGALRVRERIQYAFSGPFTGGYREIPLREGETITGVSVRENGQVYRPGGCTELGCSSPAGTFGVADVGSRTRIVWHYQATDEVRTFDIRYTLRGLAVAYDDVVDVNVKVWGDEWEERLGRLTATLQAPGKVVRAWGHPVWVRGDVQISGTAGAAARTRRPGRAVRRAPHPDPALCVHLDGRDARRLRQRPRPDRGRGAGRRRPVRARCRPHREREAASTALRPVRAPARRAPRPRRRRRRLLAVRPRAADRLRPRVRAGAPDGHAPGARADAPAAGRRGRLVRVHGDPVRPDPARRLPRRSR